MDQAAETLIIVSFVVFVATVFLSPLWAWRSWEGFFGWLVYVLVSPVAFIWDYFLQHPFSDEPKYQFSMVLSVVGLLVSALLFVVAKRWQSPRLQVPPPHGWFGEPPPV